VQNGNVQGRPGIHVLKNSRCSPSIANLRDRAGKLTPLSHFRVDVYKRFDAEHGFNQTDGVPDAAALGQVFSVLWETNTPFFRALFRGSDHIRQHAAVLRARAAAITCQPSPMELLQLSMMCTGFSPVWRLPARQPWCRSWPPQPRWSGSAWRLFDRVQIGLQKCAGAG
jgi:hypothetical protein